MRYHLILLTALLSILSGCSYLNPYISDLNFVSVQDEAQIGEQMRQQVAQEMKVVEGTSANRRVEAIGERLVDALPRKDFDYRFGVVEDATPNAFAIPGASIYVHTGLLNFVENDEELAGVLAHEVGHAYERHPAKSISRAYGLDFLSSMIFRNDTGKLKQVALNLTKGGFLSRYGREDESEADDIGYYLARRAGYSGEGLLTFLRKLEKLANGPQRPTFLSSHPPTPERVARLEAKIQQSADITNSQTTQIFG